MIKLQKEFPLLKQYKKVFEVNDKTVFAYGEDIYTNYELSVDLLAHEIIHLKQQAERGLDVWVKTYLDIPQFRLEMELEAYRHQLLYFKDRNERARMRILFAKQLSSNLYGNIIELDKAIELLWKK